MKQHTNDNHDTWQPLSLATRRLLAKIDEKEPEQRNEDRRSGNTDEGKSTEEARYIEQRIRDIETFERIVSGYYRPRRKRN